LANNDLSAPVYSILTTTFNRAHTLNRTFKSLQRQTVSNFEWIVVDDGSTDKTQDLLARWQHDAKFPMIWCRYTNNRGRNPALNTAIQIASGKYTFFLDSDDALVNDGVEIITEWINKTGFENLETYYSLFFRCVDQSGCLVGKVPQKTQNLFSDNFLKVSKKEGRYRLGLDFEVLPVLKTSIIKKFDFTELTDHEHCQEAITWNRISGIYDSIYVDYPVRKYYQFDGDCLSDGQFFGIKWPRGNYLWALSVLNEDIEYFRENSNAFLNCARKITRLGLHIGRPLSQQYTDLTNRTARLLWMLVMWRGILGYIRDQICSEHPLPEHIPKCQNGDRLRLRKTLNCIIHQKPAQQANLGHKSE